MLKGRVNVLMAVLIGRIGVLVLKQDVKTMLKPALFNSVGFSFEGP